MDDASSQKITKIKQWLGSGSINIFGLPFAGKDTHGHELAQIFDAPLLGGGDILRSDDMPQRVKEIIGAGRVLPTKDFLDIVLPRLSDAAYEGRPLILSTVGRWHGEEAGVLEATAQAGHPLRVVVYLDVDEEEVWKRWESSNSKGDRGEREDDSDPEKIKVRLEEFRNKTIPVIDFYEQQNLLIKVDGKLSKERVLSEIIDQLYTRANTDN